MTNEEIKAEAHRIRSAAAVKHGLQIKEIDFISCWNMAKNGEKLPWEKEMVEEIVVNVVPENYPGDPKEAKGYCWSDYETMRSYPLHWKGQVKKEPGFDISNDGWEQEVLRLTEINNAKTAYVNCMWAGGYVGEYPRKKEVEQLVIVTGTEKETRGIGWCNRCGSHCFGDCQAN